MNQLNIYSQSKNEKRKKLITLLKKNAPSIYNASILSKKRAYEKELQNLRIFYVNEKDETKKHELTIRAKEIKEELEVYST